MKVVRVELLRSRWHGGVLLPHSFDCPDTSDNATRYINVTAEYLAGIKYFQAFKWLFIPRLKCTIESKGIMLNGLLHCVHIFFLSLH